jgi:hypothetical protein
VSRPSLGLVGVVALLAVGYGVASATAPVTTSPATHVPERLVPVARADAVCPDPVSDASTSTALAVGAPGSGSSAPGGLTVSALGSGAGSTLGSRRSPGSLRLDAPRHSPPVTIQATGGLAPGMTATMLGRADRGHLRGLAATTCVPPGTDFWFVGSGSAVGQRGRLYLSNPSPAPALVDVTLFGPDGRVQAPAGRQIAVAAGGQEVRKLDALAPGVGRFALHVQVRQGRVAAAVRDQQVNGLIQKGTDWVPVAAPPARHQVLVGVPAGPGSRSLQVMVPGDSDAIVRVRLVNEDGSSAPAGLDVIESPSHAVSQVELSGVTRGRAVAVELSSDVPIVAGVLARTNGGPTTPADIAYATSGRALSDRAPGLLVVASVAGAAPTRVLVLAAAGRRAHVVLEPLGGDPGKRTVVDVPAQSLRLVPVSDVPNAGLAAFTVTPSAGSGPVMAAVAVSEKGHVGGLLTGWPLVPGRYQVAVPVVVADITTGLP